jgi:hypothetical protein
MDLNALTPKTFLAAGFRTETGEARPELTGLWALAVSHQLRQAGITAAQLDVAVRVLSEVALAQARANLEPQKLALLAALTDQPRALREPLGVMIDAVAERADLRPLLAHLGQVLSLLALTQATARPT